MKYSESEILLQHGVRPLLHRVEVYRYLLENRVHPTADDIYTALTRERCLDCPLHRLQHPLPIG
ncbi:MAG: hypothetical protein ACOXZ2_00740 [Sphaerochaetaceae bacterium]